MNIASKGTCVQRGYEIGVHCGDPADCARNGCALARTTPPAATPPADNRTYRQTTNRDGSPITPPAGADAELIATLQNRARMGCDPFYAEAADRIAALSARLAAAESALVAADAWRKEMEDDGYPKVYSDTTRGRGGVGGQMICCDAPALMLAYDAARAKVRT